MRSAKLNWYTAYTLPNFEKKVRDELSKRDIESYLPLQRTYRQWTDRVKKLEVPLFPNYIFIKSSDADRQSALYTKGLLKYIMLEGTPAILSNEEVELIRRLEHEDLEVEADLVEGTRVKVVRGPLSGMSGWLYSKRGAKRFGVRIDTLRQSLSLDIPAMYLEKVMDANNLK